MLFTRLVADVSKLLNPWLFEASPMFQPWRFKLKEAETALEQGRLEDAANLLTHGDMPSFHPCQQLLAEVAARIAQRGAQRARHGDLDGAWHDLDDARRLGGETSGWSTAQQTVADAVVSQAVERLKAGDYEGAQARIDKLERRKLAPPSLRNLREVTRRLESARKLGQRGKFAEAEEQLSAAVTLRSDLDFLEVQRMLMRQRADRSRILQEAIHRALAASDFTETLKLADQLLELAPECRIARDARRRAWAEVGAKLGDSRSIQETQHWPGGVSQADRDEANNDRPRQPRFVLWIDAVGGFLVCLSDEILIGQAHPGSRADIALQADISRRHARIRREGEGYVIEPLHGAVKIDGKPINGAALLSDGDEIELGQGVRLRFRRPHVLSSSARIEVVSHHRTHPYVDAVILMAESCVLGPKWQNHVVCREWKGDVVLYRNEDKLFCRAMESLEIDGKLHDGRGKLGPNSRVVGEDFSMSLEVLG